MYNENDITKIQNIVNGEIVELPPFTDGNCFVARLKKPSILGLAAKGYIPNLLLPVAESLFNGRVSENIKDSSRFKETAELFHIIAENALVEPSMQELEENGVVLTDLQYLAIFNYTQLGVKALKSFRTDEENNGDN